MNGANVGPDGEEGAGRGRGSKKGKLIKKTRFPWWERNNNGPLPHGGAVALWAGILGGAIANESIRTTQPLQG